VVIVGDIATEEARRLAQQYFGALPKTVGELPRVPQVMPPPSRTLTVEYRDKKQSAITVAFPTVSMGHDDWPALRLLQNVTSGLAGTFFAELRGNRSLAYTVFAAEGSRHLDGVFYGYLASDVSKEQEALEALIAEFGRLSGDGFSDEDVARAQAYFAGSTRIGRQTNSAHVDELAQAWMYELGLDFTDRLLERIRGISPKELREVAASYFDGDGYTTAIVSGRADRTEDG
jgi:zinc protease